MKKIFVKKINYKIFAKHNKSVIMLAFMRILFYLNISIGFVAAAYISGEYKEYKVLATTIWISILLVSTISSFYLLRKIEDVTA